jgi:PAS domain S-box-containing protein
MMLKTTQILVVDGDPGPLLETTRLLKGAGYEVLGALNGKECLDAARAKRPDLILLNMKLPDFSGAHICKTIRKDKTLVGISIYLLTSDESRYDFQTEGIDAGADGFIARPIHNKELLARVQAILRIKNTERLRLTLQTAKAGTWEWNLTTNNIRFDDFIHPLFGLAPGTFPGTYDAFLNCLAPEDRDVFGRALQRVVGQDAPLDVEFRIEWPDGSVHRLGCKVRAFQDETGRATRMTGVCIPLPDKRADELEQASKGRFDLALLGSSDGLWDWNILTNEFYYSPRFKELLGYEEGEVEHVFASFESRLHQDDMVRVLAAISDHLERRVPYDVEYRFKTRHDQYRWFRARGQAVWDEFGKAVRMAGSITDITERKEAEERIHEQAALLDKAQDAICLLDLEDRVVFWNKSAEHLYGWTVEEVAGKNADQILYKKESPGSLEAREALTTHSEWRGELLQVTKAGKEITVESRWTLVCDSDGNPKSKLIINTDSTEKKKLEQQFLRTQRMESIGTLAGGIAHDLNNALAPISMVVQLLRAKLTDADSRKLLDTIENSSQRSVDMVKQILSFSRGVQGERQVLQIKHLVSEMTKFINETFPRSVRIQTCLGKDLWAVKGDATNLYQVLMNLCVNARDAMMPKGGLLEITAENKEIDDAFARTQTGALPGPHVVLTVTDSGSGIPPHILEKIFEPFFTTKEVGQGTGLGLSTTIGIVKSHGGFLTVQSEVGRGTTFTIYLPAASEAEAEKAKEKRLPVPHGKGELVLLVDDEQAIRKITKLTLENYGYRVMTAGDGTEALALFLQHRSDINVVLTDMMMPYMDGPATIRALQKIDPNVKILAASGLASNSKVTDLEGLGIPTLLTKPYTADTLLTTLSEVLKDK